MYADPSDKRGEVIKLRLTEAEHALLEGAAQDAGLSTAAYCRSMALRLVREKLAAVSMQRDS